MVTVSLRSSVPSVDVQVVGVRGVEALDPGLPAATLGFTGEHGQTVVVPSIGKPPVKVYVALAEDPTAEQLRVAVAKALRASGKATSVALDLGELTPEQVQAVTESVLLTSYAFDGYKTKKKDEPTLQKVTIVGIGTGKAVKSAVERGTVVAEAVCATRDWVNTPPADLRPPAFAEQIKAAAAPGVKVTVWDEKRLAKERCGGILSVGRGSEAPPRIVTLGYSPAGATTHVALVGKGITFDSGGLSLKTGVGMQTMKCDMAGAATMVAVTNAVARLGLPVKVTTFACLAENMPSGSATRPGDVAAMRNGATVEILNTDAEGRMALGDGLSLAVEAGPDHIIDAATLTGAAMAALGQSYTAVLGNNAPFEQSVLDAADTAGELMWRLPITEEVTTALKSSNIADLRQIGAKPYGGALFAAAFLREFVAEVPWAHLDIAGPAFNDGGAKDYTAPGGTGAAVRTLIALLASLA